MAQSGQAVQWEAADSARWRLPAGVAVVLDRLRRAGEEAYVVGGAVRDLFWGRIPQDWDVVTSAPPPAVLALFPGSAAPGLAYGTVRVAGGVEVTTMREEGAYADRRHPGMVGYTRSLGADLARRDFTINAVVWDGARRLGGPPGAVDDLRRRMLRAVGDPYRRFREDGLRVLRLARLAGTYGLRIDAGTFTAAREEREVLAAVSRERRLGEVERLARGPGGGWEVLGALSLAFALEWPGTWPRARATVGDAPDLALFLLASAYGLAGQRGRDWAGRWPLARSRRRMLAAAFASGIDPWEVSPERLACQCRLGGPDALLWRQWACARQWCRPGDGEWDPVVPALDGREVAALTGLGGPELGRVLRAMKEWVACHPAANQAGVLAAALHPGSGFTPPPEV